MTACIQEKAEVTTACSQINGVVLNLTFHAKNNMYY